jgi:hypothetical protein
MQPVCVLDACYTRFQFNVMNARNIRRAFCICKYRRNGFAEAGEYDETKATGVRLSW